MAFTLEIHYTYLQSTYQKLGRWSFFVYLLLGFSIVCANDRRIANGNDLHLRLHNGTMRSVGHDVHFFDLVQIFVLLQEGGEVAENF